MPYQRKAANGQALQQRVFVHDQEYVRLNINPLPDGLVSVSTERGLVEVIQKPDKKPVWMKVGKLLKALGETDACARDAGGHLASLKAMYNCELKFTTTSDEVYDVYSRGPWSCMKGNNAVRVYATDDVAVAYIERDNKVLARVVVCINEELGLRYSHSYGFSQPLEALLKHKGFKKDDLHGCKLLKMEHEKGGILAPFLDGCDTVYIHDDHILIDDGGDEVADQEDGTLRVTVCGECNRAIREDDTCWSEYDDMVLCQSCFDETHVWVNSIIYHRESEDIVQLENGEYCLRDDAEYVEYRDEWHGASDVYYNKYLEEYQLKSDLVI